MLLGSDITYYGEAFALYFNVQESLDHNLDKLAVNGQDTSVAYKSNRRIEALGEAASIARYSMRKVSISPESTVCTLHPGQYLPCGIGVRAGSLFEMS